MRSHRFGFDSRQIHTKKEGNTVKRFYGLTPSAGEMLSGQDAPHELVLGPPRLERGAVDLLVLGLRHRYRDVPGRPGLAPRRLLAFGRDLLYLGRSSFVVAS